MSGQQLLINGRVNFYFLTYATPMIGGKKHESLALALKPISCL